MGKIMIRVTTASVLNLLLVLLWLDHGMGVAITERRASSSVAAKTEGDDRQRTHPELGPANFTSCAKPEDTEDILTQLLPCLRAVSIISTAPEAKCCAQLQADGLTCLCSLFERYRSRIPRGILSYRRIIELPKKCNLPIPDGTTCDGIPVPRMEANEVLDSAHTSDAVRFTWVTLNP